jgi:hypothetical protein
VVNRTDLPVDLEPGSCRPNPHCRPDRAKGSGAVEDIAAHGIVKRGVLIDVDDLQRYRYAADGCGGQVEVGVRSRS